MIEAYFLSVFLTKEKKIAAAAQSIRGMKEIPVFSFFTPYLGTYH